MSTKVSAIATEITEANLRDSTFDGYFYVVKTDGTVDYKVKKSVLQAALCGYKRFVALVSQAGGAAPTMIIQENTLGGTPVWTRSGAGDYRLTLAGVFTVNQTVQFVSPTYGFSTSITNLDVNTIKIQTAADGQMTNACIEVRVYNNIIS
jgi:hypothetical protein